MCVCKDANNYLTTCHRSSWYNNYVGGAEAMFEPLSDNYEDYEWGLAQYFGYGVQACYRGFR